MWFSWTLLVTAVLPGLLLSQAHALPRQDLDSPRPLLERHPELEYVHELDNARAYIKFAIPSLEPKSQDEEGLNFNNFELRILQTAEPCGSTNVELNQKSLKRQWGNNNDSGFDSVSINSLTSANEQRDTLAVSWHASCLDDQPNPLQVLTVTLLPDNVKESASDPLLSGFTIFFDHRKPQLLHLIPVPDLAAHNPQTARPWQNASPSQTLPIAVLTVGDRTEDVSSLEQEIAKLNLLYGTLASYPDIINGQKSLVDNLIQDELKKAKAEIADCADMTCFITTTFCKAKDALYIACKRYGIHRSPFPWTDTACPKNTPNLEPFKSRLWGEQRVAMLQAVTGECSTEHIGAEPFNHDVHTFDSLANSSPLLSSYPQNGQSITLTWDAGSWWQGEDKVLMLEIAGLFLISICFFTLISFSRRFCCSPRARADRRARCEERRTRQQYRRLARRQALRNWWANWSLFGQKSTSDYEEKRALIIAQEVILESAMQQEIEQLRYPQRLFCDPASRVEAGLNYTRPLEESGRVSRSNSLPSYRSRAGSGRPPSYKEYDDALCSVVTDGFSLYTPSGTDLTPDSSDITPDSSVIEISPRHSTETLRTEYTSG